MVADPCALPTVNCNKSSLQSPQVQRYLMMHLMASGLGLTTDDATLKTLSEGWLCQGSPAKLQLDEATAIAAADLAGVDLAHVNCWTPLQLEAAFAYLVCKGIAALTEIR